jgi:hypothetical protein
MAGERSGSGHPNGRAAYSTSGGSLLAARSCSHGPRYGCTASSMIAMIWRSWSAQGHPDQAASRPPKKKGVAPRQQRGSTFDRFYKVTDPRANGSGLGLGLHGAREIARLPSRLDWGGVPRQRWEPLLRRATAGWLTVGRRRRGCPFRVQARCPSCCCSTGIGTGGTRAGRAGRGCSFSSDHSDSRLSHPPLGSGLRAAAAPSILSHAAERRMDEAAAALRLEAACSLILWRLVWCSLAGWSPSF